MPLAKFKAGWEEYQERMLDYALERGVIAGQRAYTKFRVYPDLAKDISS